VLHVVVEYVSTPVVVKYVVPLGPFPENNPLVRLE
jgi:hypothetical protein